MNADEGDREVLGRAMARIDGRVEQGSRPEGAAQPPEVQVESGAGSFLPAGEAASPKLLSRDGDHLTDRGVEDDLNDETEHVFPDIPVGIAE